MLITKKTQKNSSCLATTAIKIRSFCLQPIRRSVLIPKFEELQTLLENCLNP
ncbi:unnamed protein product [Amoebophrya sp. A120]|nr:unnamed protein product [Amoebophrya sp. A120]|eukprot:GSA120T00008681001.1